MEIGWDTRPVSIHQPREWQNASAPTATTTQSSFVSRRRSTAASVAPPGPPPNQPIPHLPEPQMYDGYDEVPNGMFEMDTGSHSPQHPYTRPSASANLAAVAAFSQIRNANNATHPAEVVGNLSDSPPRSMLRTAARSPPTNEIVPDRLLLSPPDTRPPEPRPSSRRALTRALELAREAVKLDSTNDDPYGAVVAYGRSVALLSEVMERVMRGEDSTESHRRRNGRRRSVVAQEEEVRRLKSIHDTYADRMNILSLIYSIPLPTNSPPSTYASSSFSASTASTTPSSPTSTSPTSESSESSSSARHNTTVTVAAAPDEFVDTSDGMLAIGNAMFNLDTSTSSGGYSPRTPLAVHPYAATTPPASQTSHSIRVPAPTPPRPQVGRPRASSSLPPAAPPPTSLPPPAPGPSIVDPASQSLKPPEVLARQRGHSVSHKRTGSASRLAALPEDERLDDRQLHADTLEPPSVGSQYGRSRSPSIQRDPSRESHPLPPLPSSPRRSEISGGHDAEVDLVPTQPNSPTVSNQRPRGGSTFSVRSEMSVPAKFDHAPLINPSTMDGSISKRRFKPNGMNEPSSPDLSSPSSTSSGASKLIPSSFPAPGASVVTGRSRSSSQPGRRPSIINNNSYFPPQTAGLNGSSLPRKVSGPSRLNPNAPPQITINTAMLSPPLTNAVLPPLVPPPPIPHSNIPVAPNSPLPPSAPQDPLRKPYHMMNLLRQTMVSKTGGYVTRRLHVPQEVWSQGGAKLTNVPEKIRVVEVLCSALEEIQSFSVEYFGAGNVSSGMSMGIGSIGKKEAEAWAAKLEDFSTVCDGVVSNFGKKLSVGEGFVIKKSSGVTSWGGRLTRQFDKLTNGKNLDSPAIYVQGLCKLFNQAQILDEHTKAVCALPIAPLYAAFPADVRNASELKLRRASEFFAKVVLTFVIRDMAALLDKYVKKCEKWLAE